MCAKNRSRACSSHLSFALQQRKERCASFLTLFLCVRSFGSERYTGVGFEFARMERERSRYPTNCKLRSLYSRRKSAFRILAHNISLLLLAPDSRHILASPRRALLFISFYLLTMRTMSSGVAEKGLLERRWLRGQERVRGAGSDICYTKNVENRATKIWSLVHTRRSVAATHMKSFSSRRSHYTLDVNAIEVHKRKAQAAPLNSFPAVWGRSYALSLALAKRNPHAKS